MMKQNMFKSSTILSALLLVILTTPPTLAKSLQHETEIESQKLAARDAITLSIREVRELRKFVNSIPRLKSVQQASRMLPCVEHLINDLSYINHTLYELRHLKPMSLKSDTKSLKKMMACILKSRKICYNNSSLKNVDQIVLSMLLRKLDDLSMVIDDVVHHVSIIERVNYDVYGERP